jgi:hypothetical protein
VSSAMTPLSCAPDRPLLSGCAKDVSQSNGRLSLGRW